MPPWFCLSVDFASVWVNGCFIWTLTEIGVYGLGRGCTRVLILSYTASQLHTLVKEDNICAW